MGGSVAGLVVIALFAAAAALRTRKKLARLETLIRDARALAAADITYEPADAEWQQKLEGLDLPEGMVLLGDLVELPSGRPPSGVVRAFTDADATTFGWLARVGTARMTVMMVLSATETDTYLTRLSPAKGGTIASPPFSHREDVPYLLGINVAIARHRQRVAAGQGLRRVTTLDELQTELARLRARATSWRQAQSPATLLEKDLRAMLGRHYDTLGPRLAKRLAVEMPQARVVS